MLVTLEEAKSYLRIDSGDEDALILSLLKSAENLCMDILRCSKEEIGSDEELVKTAVCYGTSYLYEYRETADFKELTMVLKSLLFGHREVAF